MGDTAVFAATIEAGGESYRRKKWPSIASLDEVALQVHFSVWHIKLQLLAPCCVMNDCDTYILYDSS